MDDSPVITALPSWPVAFSAHSKLVIETLQTAESLLRMKIELMSQLCNRNPLANAKPRKILGLKCSSWQKAFLETSEATAGARWEAPETSGCCETESCTGLSARLQVVSGTRDPFGRFESFPHNNFVLKLMNCLFMQSGEAIYPCHT